MPTNKWLVQFELTDHYEDMLPVNDANIIEIVECSLDLPAGITTGLITVTKQEDAQTNGPENK